MMQIVQQLMEKRVSRHILFWLCWVFGFTFIKSFGKSLENYFGWFSYYVITLPVFVAHTYLVAYILVPRFFSRRLLPVFVLLFLALFLGFSVLELLLSNGFIFRWAPTGSEVMDHYLAIGNVVRSGLGNLYIVLVFLAARTVRNWALARRKQKELMQVELQGQMEDTMTKVQPQMLLYAIDHIDIMVEKSDPGVTEAIALTSELLSEVMMYHEEGHRWISREIELVKKLITLVGLFRGSKPEVEFFISGDPGTIELPPMILFSFVDLLFRHFDRYHKMPELNIEASGFSNMISLQVLQDRSDGHQKHTEDWLNAISWLQAVYKDRVEIRNERHGYGYSIMIRNRKQDIRNTVHSNAGGFDGVKPAGA